MNDASGSAVSTETPITARVSLGAIFITFLIAGAISFGGGVVAYLREYIVRSNEWLDDEEFLDALEISETLPGLNAVNMSVIIGDKLRGIPGAALATLAILLPGACIVMALGVGLSALPHNTNINRFLVGVAASAVGLLTTVTIQLGHKQLAKPLDLALVLATFAAVCVFRLPLYVVLLVLGPIAVWLYRPGAQLPTIGEASQHMRHRWSNRRSRIRH